MDLSLRLAKNDPKAGQLLQHHLRYWLTALIRSHSLISMMIANAQVQSDLDWSSDLLVKTPESRTAILAVEPNWQSLASSSTTELFHEPLATELRSFRQLLAEDSLASQRH